MESLDSGVAVSETKVKDSSPPYGKNFQGAAVDELIHQLAEKDGQIRTMLGTIQTLADALAKCTGGG